MHIETTSPECVLFPGTSGLCEAVPVGSGVGVRNEGVRGTEEEMLLLLNHQHFNEQRYVNETKHMQRCETSTTVTQTLYIQLCSLNEKMTSFKPIAAKACFMC